MSLAISENRFCHVQAYITYIMYHNWKIGPFRNRVDLQSMKTSDLVSFGLSIRNTTPLTLPSIDYRGYLLFVRTLVFFRIEYESLRYAFGGGMERNLSQVSPFDIAGQVAE